MTSQNLGSGGGREEFKASHLRAYLSYCSMAVKRHSDQDDL